MQITEQEILHSAGKIYYDRGMAYFRQNRVISVNVSRKTSKRLEFSSSVSGSGQQPYEQEVLIEKSRRSGINIYGHCSCPVSFNCKHIVAVCLEYHEQSNQTLKNTSQSACFEWLDQLSKAATDSSLSVPQGDFLVYILHQQQQPGKVAVNFHITRLLKKGGLGKGRVATHHNVYSSYYRPDYIQDEDVEITELIRASNESHSRSTYIQGALGFIALHQMLRSGRCFWEDIDKPPMQLGEERELGIAWQQHEDGSASLQVNIADDCIPLLTEPALYIDTQHRLVGTLVNMPHTSSQLKTLLTAPHIPEALMTEFSRRTAQILPPTIVPPPTPVQIEEVTGRQPIPCLRLFAKETKGESYHLMRLRFCYGEHEIGILPKSELCSFTRNENLIHIYRHLEAEDTFADQLQAMGFEVRTDESQKDLFFLSFAATEI
ncbi:MAG: hypothetical protein Q9M23_05315, partial [Mariprofundaceae bacterium]|nr:hypothetical protein [Mariprofundaceae bacterium]